MEDQGQRPPQQQQQQFYLQKQPPPQQQQLLSIASNNTSNNNNTTSATTGGGVSIKEGLRVHSGIVELEKQHKILLKKKSIFDKSVVALRNSIRDEYEKLLFIDYDFAVSKDVEQNLWKTVFYKVIEEYRKRIRKCIPQQPPQNATSVSQKDELQRICESFRSFLWLSSKFYQELISKFQKKYDLTLDGSVDYELLNESNNAHNLHKSYTSCHRCLIFLGDLARYHRDLYGHPAQKDWIKAANYYQQALHLIPDNGNPHNQLAVLATYADDEFNAVYHYLMSLAVTSPFATAKDNLSVLFEKNRVKSLDESANPITKKKNFIINFVRLHGVLFTKTGLEDFGTIKQAMLKEFVSLLADLTEDFLLKVLVINICSLQNLYIESSTSTYAEVSQKAVLTEHAFSLSNLIFSATVKAALNNSTSYLGPLSVFMDYLRCHPNIMKQALEQSKQDWLSDCTALMDTLSYSEGDYSVLLLPEEVELRGFLPLRALYRSMPVAPGQILSTRDNRYSAKIASKITEFVSNAKGLLTTNQPIKDIVMHADTEPPSSIDNVEDEVILFKPGEGVKVEIDHDHQQPAIGSGRASTEKIGVSSISNPATYQSFGLFGGSSAVSGSSSLFTTPIQQNPNGHPYSAGYNSFFEANTNYNWTPVSPSHSLFTNDRHKTDIPHNTPVGSINPWSMPSNSLNLNPNDESFTTPTNNSGLFPFPGQNQQRYKTRNPFIS